MWLRSWPTPKSRGVSRRSVVRSPSRRGERLHPELDAVFIAQPDRSVSLPTSAEIAKCWEDVHNELLSRFKTLSSKEWLESHGNVSPEEFERNPTRNRLAV